MTVNILELAREHGLNPKRTAATNGGEYESPCPDPNCGGTDRFKIWPEENRYWCRRCDKKGDPIQYCRDFLKMGYKEAREKVGSAKSELSAYSSEPRGKNKTPTQDDEEKLQKSRTISADIWMKAAEEGKHPYFEKKGIQPVPGIRYGQDEKGNPSIVVPYRDVEGTLQAIQYINGNPPPNKFFAKETTANGASFTLDGLEGSRIVYICEGIATAASVWLSENKAITTLSCGSGSNIQKVVKTLKDKYPEIEIVVCLDDDKAGDKAAQAVSELRLSRVSFCRPDFTGMARGDRDKDFNDIYKLAGIEKVKEQLQKEWTPPSSLHDLGRISLDTTAQYYQTRPAGIDIGLRIDGEPLELPSAGMTVFAAPTKHGKTHALVNASYLAITRNPNLDVVFVTLEELAYPICLRFLNRHLGMTLCKGNMRSLAHYFGRQNHEDKYSMFSGISTQEFERKKDEFFLNFMESGRLRILDFNHSDGTLSTFESFEKQIREIKKHLPRVGMIALDYLQLMNLSGAGRMSRDEVLKEICLGIKDLSATTGLPIVTAAQFNRTVLNEDGLHASAIGEAGSIERQSALCFGMFNRTFPQFEKVGTKLDRPQKEEILLNVMLNRNGPSQQKIAVPYNGNMGRIDFNKALQEEQKTKSSPEKRIEKNPSRPNPRFGGDDY